MTTALNKNRWLAGALLALLVTVLYMTVSRLRGRMPVLEELPPTIPLRADLTPAGKVAGAFHTNQWPKIHPAAGLTNLLFTTQFVPPPPPVTAPPPPPPPPPPRKVALLYQGFFETAETVRHAYLQVDTNQVLIKLGSNVVADVHVAEIGRRTLILTNSAGQTNVIPFRVPKEIEVPAK
jgi:hypothetical protein